MRMMIVLGKPSSRRESTSRRWVSACHFGNFTHHNTFLACPGVHVSLSGIQLIPAGAAGVVCTGVWGSCSASYNSDCEQLWGQFSRNFWACDFLTLEKRSLLTEARVRAVPSVLVGFD